MIGVLFYMKSAVGFPVAQNRECQKGLK